MVLREMLCIGADVNRPLLGEIIVSQCSSRCGGCWRPAPLGNERNGRDLKVGHSMSSSSQLWSSSAIYALSASNKISDIRSARREASYNSGRPWFI